MKFTEEWGLGGKERGTPLSFLSPQRLRPGLGTETFAAIPIRTLLFLGFPQVLVSSPARGLLSTAAVLPPNRPLFQSLPDMVNPCQARDFWSSESEALGWDIRNSRAWLAGVRAFEL